MVQIVFGLGTYWLGSAAWLHMGGEPAYVWLALLPAVWLSTLGVLRG